MEAQANVEDTVPEIKPAGIEKNEVSKTGENRLSNDSSPPTNTNASTTNAETTTETTEITKPKAAAMVRPIKKARTAYFIFASEKRRDLQIAYPGEGVASIARRTGQLWSTLTTEEKQKYQIMAAQERSFIAEQLKLEAVKQQQQQGDDEKEHNTSSTPTIQGSSTLPVTRIRKIMKLDPEVKGISKESIHLITKCAELFTVAIGNESVKIANIQNRRKLLPEDMAEVCGLKERFFFLKEDVKDFMKDMILEKEEKERQKKKREEEEADSNKSGGGGGGSNNTKKKSKKDASIEGVRTLNTFWNQVT